MLNKNLKSYDLRQLMSLSISDLRHQSVIEDSANKSGIIDWHDKDGKLEARIQFKSSIQDDDNATLHVKYCINDIDQHDYKIKLSRTGMHFGGFRYWFHCPETDKRVTTLYLEPDDGRFLSRCALGALYPSQSQTDFDRALAMRNKYAAKLEGLPDMKPKGMHHSTFIKLYDKYKHYNDLALKLMARRFERYEDRIT